MVDALELTRSAMDNGNLLLAYDLAMTALAEDESSPELQHLAVLALARMGDAEQAMELFHRYALDRSTDPHHRAIAARILKDAALATEQGNGRNDALLEASEAYKLLFQESDDAYPGINAASLAFLGGRKDEARQLARLILEMPEVSGPADYYAAATKGEAQLITGQIDAAAEALHRAGSLPGANSGAKSSSLRQLTLIAQEAGVNAEHQKTLLAPIAPPSVIFYCGHMFLENAKVEAELRDNIETLLASNDVGFAYGALAAGADILIAEALLARGGELHVTLPFLKDDFLAQSIAPAGGNWLKRFEACFDAATSVHYATEMHYVGDPEQYGYASRVAMGMARLRADFLGISARQLAVWDGTPPSGPAGTGADVQVWQAYGGQSDIVTPKNIDRNLGWSKRPEEDSYKRRAAAMLFTDFPGFSKLPEARLPAFWSGVMGRMADVLAKHDNEVLARNSWGDALLAVTVDAPRAATIALELQSALQDFDYSSLGLSETSGMRIGVHYGPVYETSDLITGRTTFYGTEVSRAARIEPVTPPGAVFVTQPFAAILTLEARDQFRCRYVGNVEFAKNYGTYPIYRLTAA